MVKEIKTKRVELRSVGGSIRRYEDECGVFWYAYEELCSLLLITHQARKNIFNNWLLNHDKNEFKDVLDHGHRSLFISTNAVSMLINRNNERANNMLKELISNENTINTTSVTDLDKRFEKLESIVNRPGVTNYVDLCLEVRDITKSDEFRNIMDKYDDNYDKEKEELLDIIREDVYNYDDIEECEVILMRKRPDANDEEMKLCYKKFKAKGGKSTCPDWIREIIK